MSILHLLIIYSKHSDDIVVINLQKLLPENAVVKLFRGELVRKASRFLKAFLGILQN